ncbi:MAG: carboxymuconolactone decarboxylase family protein [Mycobacteriaceae bacterium]
MPTARVQPGLLRELGMLNWGIARIAARLANVEKTQLFLTLGKQKNLFRWWLLYSAAMMPLGRISRKETELVILRVAHLRDCQYELDHHTHLASRAKISAATRAQIFIGPHSPEWDERQRSLLLVVDELIANKDIANSTWEKIRQHLTEPEIIELCFLITQYDGLATTIRALRIQRDVFKSPLSPR